MGASCWRRFWWELRPSYPFYSLEEATSWDSVEADNDANNNNNKPATQERRHIDVAKSFAPHRWAVVTRFLFLAWSLQVLKTDVTSYPPHNLYIYFGYLTHWGHLLSNWYFICSFLCTITPSAVRQPKDGVDTPGRLVRATWGLYSCVAPLEIAITLLYWSGTPFLSGHGSYVAVMEHGGIATLILIDGLLVGLVPIRAKHVVFLMMVSLLYMTWSVVDAVLEIGNGEWGPAYEDDALYPVLNWNDDQKGATIVSAFVICILSPCLFYGCWLLSLKSNGVCGRGAVVNINNTMNGTDDDNNNEFVQHGCCSSNFDGSRRPLYPLNLDSDGGSSAPHYKVMEDVELV